MQEEWTRSQEAWDGSEEQDAEVPTHNVKFLFKSQFLTPFWQFCILLYNVSVFVLKLK